MLAVALSRCVVSPTLLLPALLLLGARLLVLRLRLHAMLVRVGANYFFRLAHAAYTAA